MAASGLADTDLHGLVDGRIEPGRRADVLRRLAASSADRALVEAWQDQADLIREAFRDVPAEALPVALDLAPPRLRSIDPARLQADLPPKGKAPVRRTRHGGGAALAAALVITIGLTMSWMAGLRDDTAAPPAGAANDGDKAAALPSFRVPDLAATGLRLTDVSSEPDSATVVLRYREGGGRVALRVARNAADIGAMPLELTGKALTWRTQNTAFSLTGTVAPERLRAVAVALQAGQGSD